MINPDKYIRGAYIAALQAATGLKVWHKRVPKTANPIPTKYIIIDSQTKNEIGNAKPVEYNGDQSLFDWYGNSQTYFEWLVTLDINIYNVNALGFTDATVVEDIEQIVINVVREGVVTIPNFDNKDTRILESQDLSVETATQSIDRKLIKFEHWLSQK